jgi:diacylglycerol kinase
MLFVVFFLSCSYLIHMLFEMMNSTVKRKVIDKYTEDIAIDGSFL